MIPVIRHMQAVRQGSLAMNRLAGTGAGSGMGLQLLGSATIGTVAGITASGSPTVITGSRVNFLVGRPAQLLVWGSLNAGSNCGAGLFNLVALNGDGGIDLQGAWPYAMCLGIGAGTINYLPFSLLTIVRAAPGNHSVNWQVNANTTGSVTVNNGNLYVFQMN